MKLKARVIESAIATGLLMPFAASTAPQLNTAQTQQDSARSSFVQQHAFVPADHVRNFSYNRFRSIGAAVEVNF